MYQIYIITNAINAKQYVGITNDIDRRWRRHKNANEGQLIHVAIKKYGLENFVFSHIASAFDAESAKAIEIMFIAEHNTLSPNGYNLTKGGDGTYGRSVSADLRKRIKDQNKQTWSNPELRKSLGEKISRAKKGLASPKKGKPSGKKGIPHSPDHVKNLTAALNTPEYKENVSKRFKELWSDPEYKARQSASRKAAWAIRKAKQSSEAGEKV
jgi:group I intron endonuclease